MSALPRSLRYYLSTLAVSRNTTVIRPQSDDSARPLDVITFDLPNTLTNLDSLRLNFKLTTGAPSGGTYCRLNGVHSIIERISVESNGTPIDPGCPGTNQIYTHYDTWQIGADKRPLRRVLQAEMNGNKTPAALGNHTAEKLCIADWLGFLGTAQPRLFDVSNLPLKVHIQLAAPNKCFMSDANPNSATISLTEIWACAETLDIQDGGIFYQAVTKLMESAPLEVPFTKWYYTQSGPVQGTRDSFYTNASVSSLDSVTGLILPSGYAASTQAPVAHTPEGAFTFAGLAASNATESNILNSATLSNMYANLVQSQVATYKAPYFVQGFNADGNSLVSSGFDINSVSYPKQRPAPVELVFEQTADHMGALKDTVGGSARWLNGLSNFQNYGFAHAIPLEYPNAESEMRLVSGLNFLGNTAGIVWNTETTGTGYVKAIVLKTTATLRVSPAKQCEVIY